MHGITNLRETFMKFKSGFSLAGLAFFVGAAAQGQENRTEYWGSVGGVTSIR
jgi:hypothetical protein